MSTSTTEKQSAAIGAQRGAALGATAGSLGGPLGMLIGFGVGALSGGVIGGLSGRSHAKRLEEQAAAEDKARAAAANRRAMSDADAVRAQRNAVRRPLTAGEGEIIAAAAGGSSHDAWFRRQYGA